MLITNRSQRYVDELASISALFTAGQRFRSEGKQPIDLSIGNPNLKPPKGYYDALREIVEKSEAAKENHHGYSPVGGFPDSREKLASELGAFLETPFGPHEVFFTAGATNALDVVLAAIIEPDDEVVLIAPYFIEYPNLVDVHHGRAVIAEAGLGSDLDIEEIGSCIGPKTKALILNSPNNPTGAVYGEHTLNALTELLLRKNREFGNTIVVIEDASYNHILFNGTSLKSMLGTYDFTVFSSSFSKSLSIAGERLGYFAVSPSMNADEADQKAFLAALTVYLRMRVVHAPALQQRIIGQIGINCSVDAALYDQRQRVLSDCLEEQGFTFNRPDGAFYIFAELPPSFDDESAFRARAHSGEDPLLYVPGSAFGRFPRHVRFSACVAEEDIQRACRKLKRIVGFEGDV